MTITYFPFGAGAGSTVDESEWSAMARWFRETGIIPGALNDFEVYGDSTGMQVKVKSGQAIIVGHYIENDAEVIKSISTADGSNPRIDRIVLQVDWVNNDITIDVLTGTPAGSPTAPSLTQTSSVWEFSLAQVYVGTGVSTINPGDVTDERVFSRGSAVSSRLGDRQTTTISSGAITVETEKGYAFYQIAGEGAAADILTDIDMSSPQDGALLILIGQSGYDITLTNAGNIWLGQDLDQVVIRNNNPVMFLWDSNASAWKLIGVDYVGKKSIFLTASSFYPLDTINVVPTIINSAHSVLEFIDAADDYAVVNFEMPKDYDGGDLTIYVWWIAGVTGTNSVVWHTGIDMLADGEAYSADDDTGTVTDAAQNSVTEVLRSAAITLSPTWVSNDLAVLTVGRLGTNGSDTLAGDAYLVGLKIEYLTNKPDQN